MGKAFQDCSVPASGKSSGFYEHFRFSVIQIGRVASKTLAAGATGRVSALFDSSFYVEMESGLVCVGGRSVGASPLNLVTMASDTTNWRASGLRLNDKVSLIGGGIRVGNRFFFDLADAAEWSPDPVSACWTANSLARGLDAFRVTTRDIIPSEGLGGFIFSKNHPLKGGSECRIADMPVNGLYYWLLSSFRESGCESWRGLHWVKQLIGLGPGLTPSGDDFIGGMMIALHCLGKEDVCYQLWRPSRRYAQAASNPISVAHLDAAAEGAGNDAVHRTLAAILSGRTEAIKRTAANIDSIGHTSGWDTMAGVVTAFDAWLWAGKDRLTRGH